jgi:hypothetical protein
MWSSSRLSDLVVVRAAHFMGAAGLAVLPVKKRKTSKYNK